MTIFRIFNDTLTGCALMAVLNGTVFATTLDVSPLQNNKSVVSIDNTTGGQQATIVDENGNLKIIEKTKPTTGVTKPAPRGSFASPSFGGSIQGNMPGPRPIMPPSSVPPQLGQPIVQQPIPLNPGMMKVTPGSVVTTPILPAVQPPKPATIPPTLQQTSPGTTIMNNSNTTNP